MARIFRHWIAEPSRCSYLADRDASLEYRFMVDVSPEELDALLVRGWRRFGVAYFRPKCRGCSECVPLRIPVATFTKSRQQRRTWSKVKDLRLEIRAPLVDEERLALYKRWHEMQGEKRGWSEDTITAEEYYYQFAYPHPSVRELAYYDDAVEGEGGKTSRLVAVSIVDETPSALSAVYTYHDPDYRKLSLGTGSILFQLQLASQLEKRWVYLGYRVLGCRSSEYKGNFGPHELLVGWPDFDERPEWMPSGGVEQ